MNILLVEPFFSGSHRRWAQELQAFSTHNVELLTLPGKYWKWRMYGGAVALADKFADVKLRPDLILASDMLDLSTFLGLTRKQTAKIPTAVYFHENQITYPWSPTDADVALQRNNQYGFLNYTTALVADAIFFNSNYHKESFLGALPQFLKQFPDKRGLQNVERLRQKSRLLYLGMDLQKSDAFHVDVKNEAPVILWNHRREYDKNPEAFFNALFKMKEEGLDFRLIVAGESYSQAPEIFAKAERRLKDEIISFKYAGSYADYARLLHCADILPVTSNQDFFGGSVVEAIYCNCYPILPKRLAYPEHLPQSLHSEHFYETEEQFYQKLKKTVLRYTAGKFMPKFRQYVVRYDWRNSIKEYDRVFNEVALLPS